MKKSLKKGSSFSDSAVPKKTDHVFGRRNIDGSFAILDLEREESYYCVDHAAADCWGLINGKNSLGDIKKRISVKYGVSSSIFLDDFFALIRKLHKVNLISF